MKGRQLIPMGHPAAFGFGTQFITVGSGGKISNIMSALDMVMANTPDPEAVFAAYGGTVSVAQYSDVLTFTGLSESFNIAGVVSALSLIEPLWIDLGDGKFRLLDRVNGIAQIILTSGYEGATLTNVSYTLYRLPSWDIFLLPNERHIISDLYHLSNYMRGNVTIRGASMHNTTLEHAPTPNGNSITIPSAGRFAMRNLSIFYTNGNRPIGNYDSNFTTADEQLCGSSVVAENLLIRSVEGNTAKNAVGFICAEIFANNLHISTKDQNSVFHADRIEMNNVHAEVDVTNPSVQPLVSIQAAYWQSTKEHKVNNVSVKCVDATKNNLGFILHGGVGSGTTKTVLAMSCSVEEGKIVAQVKTGGSPNDLFVYLQDSIADEVVADNARLIPTNVKPKDAASNKLVVSSLNSGLPLLNTVTGNAVVASGSTSASFVVHGLGIQPDPEDFTITPTNDLGNAVKWWVSNITAATFNINVDVAPGVNTATFAWRIQRKDY